MIIFFSEWKFKISEVLVDGNFHEEYEELQKNLDEAQKDSYYADAADFLYKKYMTQLSKKK